MGCTGIHGAMYRLAHIVFVAVLLPQLEFAGAQGMPENVTVDSVLTMAKEAAETGTTEFNRVWLRGRAADAIHRLGRDAVFGDYVAEAVQGVRQQPYRWRDVASDEEQRLRHEDAKRLFLSGDTEAAKKLLGPVFQSFDVGIRINDYVLNVFFSIGSWSQEICPPLSAGSD
jgi:hypothetical protein